MKRFARLLLLAGLAVPAPAALAEPDAVDAWCVYLGTRLRSVSAEACRNQDFRASSVRTPQGNALVLRDIEPSQPLASATKGNSTKGNSTKDSSTKDSSTKGKSAKSKSAKDKPRKAKGSASKSLASTTPVTPPAPVMVAAATAPSTVVLSPAATAPAPAATAPAPAATAPAATAPETTTSTQPPLRNAKRIMVIGGIHGDELTSISVVFRWLDWFKQPEAASYHWRVIPVANPDGFSARPSTRTNANGIDLNRNFQTPDWDKDAENYWVNKTKRDPRRYPGKVAGSEIETRWLQAQIEGYKPDLIISIHAPYNLLDYDGPVPQPMRFGRLSLNRLGVYPGSLGNYAGVHKNIPVITIELPNATVMPSQRDQQMMWEDMLKWMKNNIKGLGGGA